MVTCASVLSAQVEHGGADDGRGEALLALPSRPHSLPRWAAGRSRDGSLLGPILPAMQRAAYLDDPDVCDFRDWAAPLVAGTRPFRHGWHSRKWGSWSCETLFDAFRKYEWRFKVDVPGRGECRGRSYAGHGLDVLDERSSSSFKTERR